MNTAIEAKLLSIIQTKDPYDVRVNEGFLEMCYRLGTHDLRLQASEKGGYSIFVYLTNDAYVEGDGLLKAFTHTVKVNTIHLVRTFEERFDKEIQKRQEEARIAAQAQQAKMEAEFLAALGE